MTTTIRDLGEELAEEIREALAGRNVTVAASLGDSVAVTGATPADATGAYYALTTRYIVHDMARTVIVVMGRRS